MTSVSKNVFIDKLDDTVNKYNNTYNSTIKMKHPDIKWSPYTDSSKEINAKDPKFKIGDIVRISKHKYIFANGLKFLWLRKLKILCYGPMLLMILIEKKLLEHFTKKNWKKNKSRGA